MKTSDLIVRTLAACALSFSMTPLLAQTGSNTLTQPAATGSGAPSGNAANTQQPNVEVGGNAAGREGVEAQASDAVRSEPGVNKAAKRWDCTKEQIKKNENGCGAKAARKKAGSN